MASSCAARSRMDWNWKLHPVQLQELVFEILERLAILRRWWLSASVSEVGMPLEVVVLVAPVCHLPVTEVISWPTRKDCDQIVGIA